MPSTEVLGISVDEPLDVLKNNVARIASETASFLNLPFKFTPDDIHANTDYIGKGYALMGDYERETIRLLARLEGVLIDPVYSGKAFGGMIDLIRKGVIKKKSACCSGTPAGRWRCLLIRINCDKARPRGF